MVSWSLGLGHTGAPDTADLVLGAPICGVAKRGQSQFECQRANRAAIAIADNAGCHIGISGMPIVRLTTSLRTTLAGPLMTIWPHTPACLFQEALVLFR